MRTAFVLTGGGSLGAVQVGMMQALHERGIAADLLVGTSVGAVNAAYLAGPGTTPDRLGSLAALWSRMRRKDVFAADPWRWWHASRGLSPSLFSAEPLRTLLQRCLGYQAFEDARLEVHVTATDVVTGAALILGSGPVTPAVLASTAVPGLLPPVRHADSTLVDGAVGHASTLGFADSRGVADIYLLPAGYPCAGPRPNSALSVALTALSLVLHQQLIAEVRGYTGHARLHVVPPLCPMAVSSADFSQAAMLVRRGHDSTRDWLDRDVDGSAHDPAGTLSFHGRHHENRAEGRAGPEAPARGRPTQGAPA